MSGELKAKAEAWWFISSEEYPEDGCTGGGATREEAIAQGRIDYPGEDFWLHAGRIEKRGEFMPNAGSVLELACDIARDDGLEDYAEEVTDAAKEKLDLLLESWALAHFPKPCRYLFVGQPERIENGGDPPVADTEPAPAPDASLMAEAVERVLL